MVHGHALLLYHTKLIEENGINLDVNNVTNQNITPNEYIDSYLQNTY